MSVMSPYKQMEVLHFPHWKFRPVPPFSGVWSQQDSKVSTNSIHWRDLDGNKEAIHPIISVVPRNLWGRDILENIGAVLTTDDRVFFDNLEVHDGPAYAFQ